MLASIHPLGERARHTTWGITAGAYAIGSTVGGAALAAALGLAGHAMGLVSGHPRGLVLALFVAACAVTLAFDLGVAGLSLPTVRRQVNEDWLALYRGWVYGVGFGFQLGLGIATIVTTATVYLTFAMAFLVGLAGSVGMAATIGAVFGATRAAPILAVARVATPAHLRATHRRMQAAAPVARGASLALPCMALVMVVGAAAAGWD
ncbi:MAG: hypothetical protein M3378_11255 [Actinomycetota bacterium]|nr:hypothetical protein [Actinomycetota bacterium]